MLIEIFIAGVCAEFARDMLRYVRTRGLEDLY